MNAHRLWLLDNHLEIFVYGNRPDFLDNDCLFDDNHGEVCILCKHKKECEIYFKPLSDALERHWEIGEV